MSNPETTETGSDLLVSASVCVVGVLAEALAQHGYFGSRLVLIGDSSDSDEMDDYRYRISCQCGWSTLTAVSQADRAEGEKDFGTIHSAHVASVVAALPNIAIVQLPEDDGETRIHGASALDGIYDLTVGVPRDRVSHRSLNDITSVESMEHLGLALLAAARAARAAGGQA